MTARSYSRALGANDRIRLGQLGCGSRSRGHVHMVQMASRHTPVEVVAVCDIWKIARERRAAQVKSMLGVDAEQYHYSEQMLARKDIDGVMIATGDFPHAKLCIDVVKAAKDCVPHDHGILLVGQADILERQDGRDSGRSCLIPGPPWAADVDSSCRMHDDLAAALDSEQLPGITASRPVLFSSSR